jgi:hypothetical protein
MRNQLGQNPQGQRLDEALGTQAGVVASAPTPVDHMMYGKRWMSDKHPWTGITHYLPDLLSPRLVVAVYSALGTRRLVRYQRALVYALVRIRQQLLTICAECAAGTMMGFAV